MQSKAGYLAGSRQDDDLVQQLATERKRANIQRLIDRVIVLALIIGVWEGVVRQGLVLPLFISQPSAIANDLVRMVASGYVFPHLAVTLYEALAGLAIGTLDRKSVV